VEAALAAAELALSVAVVVLAATQPHAVGMLLPPSSFPFHWTRTSRPRPFSQTGGTNVVHASRKDSEHSASLMRMTEDNVLESIVLSVVGRVKANVVVPHRDCETEERETGDLGTTEKPSAQPSSIALTVRLIRNTCERGEGRIFGFRGAAGIPMVNIVFDLSLSSIVLFTFVRE
jgi:hypothetical protein